jgi:hypothetical protein
MNVRQDKVSANTTNNGPFISLIDDETGLYISDEMPTISIKNE